MHHNINVNVSAKETEMRTNISVPVRTCVYSCNCVCVIHSFNHFNFQISEQFFSHQFIAFNTISTQITTITNITSLLQFIFILISAQTHFFEFLLWTGISLTHCMHRTVVSGTAHTTTNRQQWLSLFHQMCASCNQTQRHAKIH